MRQGIELEGRSYLEGKREVASYSERELYGGIKRQVQ